MAQQNTEKTYLEVIRRVEVLRVYPKCKSSLYLDEKNGLFPRSFSIGQRSQAYYKHEVIAVIAAMGAGRTQTQIKALVCKLLEQRQELAKGAYHE
ncbi:MAG: prophage regulatory protein [Cognaticolwellia sp.]|jgi:prophage regulatory protein